MNSRLTTSAPDLVPRLALLSEDELRNIVFSVAREAAIRNGLDDPVVLAVLDRNENDESTLVNAGVQQLVERLDEMAWEIQESAGHESPQYMAAFQRARAASAVAFALRPDRESALESIYEAQAALGSAEALPLLIEPLLSGK